MDLTARQLRDVCGALGERLRLRLACCLLGARDGLTVAEMTSSLSESQPNVSRHLKLMRAAGLVEERREGRWVYYALRDAKHPFFDNIRCCVETACCCDDIQQDLRRLRERLKLRRDGKCVIGFFQERRAPRRSRAGRERRHR